MRPLIRVSFTTIILTVVVFVTACDSGESGKPVNNIAKDNTKDEPITEANNIYGSLVMAANKGDKQLGDTLVIALKVMAGELSAKTIYKKYKFTEGFGVVETARKYLKSGKNEKSKKELRRLLKIVVPKPVLPRKSTARKLISITGLATLGKVLLGQAAYAAGSCRSALRSGSYNRECHDRRDWTYGGYPHVIIYPKSMSAAVIDRTQQAINRSIDTYNRLSLTGNSLEIMMVTRTAGDFGAEALPTPGTAVCPFIVYPRAIARASAAEYKQIVAHEIFHCYQAWNFSSQLFGRGSMSADQYVRYGYAAQWWREGTADYFSNKVYPCSNYEHRSVRKFDRRSVRMSILSMVYEANVFFQHLGNTVGDAAIIALLRSLPSYGGTQNQAQALARMSGIAETFHDFAKKYLDKKIKDSCRGQMVPVNPKMGEALTVTHNIRHQFNPPVRNFQIARKLLVFPAGRYHLTSQPKDGIVRVSAKYQDSWKKLPFRLDDPVKCTAGTRPEKKVVVAVTFANTQTRNNFTLIDDQTKADQVLPIDGAPLAQELDRCLIGAWIPDKNSKEALLARFRSISGGRLNLTIRSINGRGRVDKRGNYAGFITMTSRGFMNDAGTRLPVTSAGRVTSCGRMYTKNGRLYFTNVIENGLIVVNIKSYPMRFPVNRVGSSFSIPYRCRGNILSLKPGRNLPELKSRRVIER